MAHSVYKKILISSATIAFAVFSVSAMMTAAPSGLRSIFLNGSDISGARNQQLKNVDVQIAENGDIFIVAPQYQVAEEDAFTPLSKFVQGMKQPVHKAPQKISAAESVPAVAAPAMVTAPVHQEPKALEKDPTPAEDGTLPKAEDPPPPQLPEDSAK
jgi:hypothetical protein